jgi:hypothetical protein
MMKENSGNGAAAATPEKATTPIASAPEGGRAAGIQPESPEVEHLTFPVLLPCLIALFDCSRTRSVHR